MRKIKSKIFVTMGLLLLAAALCLTVYNLWDGFRAEQSARQAVDFLEDQIPSKNTSESDPNEIPDYILNPNMNMPEKTKDGIDYIGILEIPSLDLKLPVISEWSYPNLKIAPCRYSGSAYLDNMVIAAHNYSSHFGLLDNLKKGDKAFLIDMDGNRFDYEVELVEMLPPTSVEEMTSSGYDLSLFTCNLSGEARVTVRLNRVSN